MKWETYSTGQTSLLRVFFWLIICIIKLTNTIFMLKWSAIFLLIAIVAAIFGFTGIAAGAAAIAKTLFFIFIILVLVTFVLGITILKK
jgi:uncharacterized membrane protein YtjA (UPF0391 family)